MLLNAWENEANTGHSLDLSPLYKALDLLRGSLSTNEDYRIGIATSFYIGAVESRIVLELQYSGAKVDQALAQDALRNFDKVLVHNQEIPEWRVFTIDANYLAGNTAYVIDGGSEIAVRYWNKCAAMGHPGCINNVAHELLKKPTLTDDGIRHVLDLHASVVNTGNHNRCAGQYSALTMAKLIHFTGIKRPGDDDVALVDTAQTLFRQYKETVRTSDPCGSERIGLDQFMMRVDRGERHEAFLDEVEQNSRSPLWRQIAGYLHGRTSDSELLKNFAAGDAGEICQIHFYAAWKAMQDGKGEAARGHCQAMLRLPADDCVEESLMMRRDLKLPASG
jgi:hypothetical protein